MAAISHEQTYQPNRPTQYNLLDEADYFLAKGLAGRALVIYQSIDTVTYGYYENPVTRRSEPVDFNGIRARRNAGIACCKAILG